MIVSIRWTGMLDGTTLGYWNGIFWFLHMLWFIQLAIRALREHVTHHLNAEGIRKKHQTRILLAVSAFLVVMYHRLYPIIKYLFYW